ncbi:MAG: cation:proton antiporter [Akkermansia sp.]|nr:cation:proton antiporter [Akkermansia sp.]
MIHTLAIALVLSLVLGMLAQRIKLSPLVGYLLAGMLAAQPWWGIGADPHEIMHEFANIGEVLLLFGVGLHFHFKDLLAVRKVAVPGSLMCMALWTGSGALVYHALVPGADWVAALLFGMCVCVSSTVVLTRVLEDSKLLHTPSGHTAVGWLVMEDIFTIVLLVLLPAVFVLPEGGGKAVFSTDGIVAALWGMAWKLTLMVVCVAFVGRYLISKVLTFVARNNSNELFTLSVLTIALGVAVLSAEVFNASMVFGAFLSGMVVGQSKFASRAAADALPMRDAFAVLFFVSVGMGFNFMGLIEHWQLALGTLALTLLWKPISAYIIIRLLRRPGSLGVVVGSSLSQIGEFSFILAAMVAGERFGLLPHSAVNIITGVAIVTITLNTVLFRYVPALIRQMEDRGIGMGRKTPQHPIPLPSEERDRVIVVGHGPCGELMTGILRHYNLDVVVLEMNIDTVTRLQAEGMRVLHGDARLRSILTAAGVEGAHAIIVTSSAAPAKEIFAAARSLNPKITMMAHTTYMRNAQQLRQHKSADVYSGEEEVALSMVAGLLRRLGATEEQVFTAGKEARTKLFGPDPEEAEETAAV